MNLENLNLVELNAQEVRETEGGNWFDDAITLLVVPAYVALSVIGQVGIAQAPYHNP